MKLQINTRGSWKNVCEFNANRRDQVIAVLIPLSRALNDDDAPEGRHASVRFCLVDDSGKRKWLGILDDAKAARSDQ